VVEGHTAGGERPTGLESPKVFRLPGSRLRREEGHHQRGRRRV